MGVLGSLTLVDRCWVVICGSFLEGTAVGSKEVAPAMLVEKQFDTGEVVVNYVENAHARPPLVMIHGNTGWWQDFLHVLPVFSARWHTYAVDLRGHGRSGRVRNGYQWEAFSRDCIALLKSETITGETIRVDAGRHLAGPGV